MVSEYKNICLHLCTPSGIAFCGCDVFPVLTYFIKYKIFTTMFLCGHSLRIRA